MQFSKEPYNGRLDSMFKKGVKNPLCVLRDNWHTFSLEYPPDDVYSKVYKGCAEDLDTARKELEESVLDYVTSLEADLALAKYHQAVAETELRQRELGDATFKRLHRITVEGLKQQYCAGNLKFKDDAKNP